MPDHYDPSPSSLPVLSHADGLANAGRDLFLLLGRVILGWIFVESGWRKLQDIPAFAATMGRRGLPEFLGYLAPPVEFIGGLMILAGFATRYMALLMLLFMVIATFSSHAYWKVPADQVATQYGQFWKNMTIKGGFILLFVVGAGKFSLDSLLRRK